MITEVAAVEQQKCIIDPATKTHFSVSGLNGVTADYRSLSVERM
jgi:hypothetical protein